MAADTSNGIIYFLSLPVEHKDFLGAIRHWERLKIAFEEDRIWVKDFSPAQVNSVAVKSIPYKQLYYASGPKLFLLGSQLPDRNLPDVLWTPIERGLPVQLPSFNHNYFGITDRITIELKASDKEQDPFALITSLRGLETYLIEAPAVRLQLLSWVLLGDEQALILGLPLLPIPGETYWRKDDALLPSGYDLELPALSSVLNASLNGGDEWLVWNKDGSYFTIGKKMLRPLSRSSFRRSIKN